MYILGVFYTFIWKWTVESWQETREETGTEVQWIGDGCHDQYMYIIH